MAGICACALSGIAGIGSMARAGSCAGAAVFAGATDLARAADFTRVAVAFFLAGTLTLRFVAGSTAGDFGCGIGIFMPGIPGIACLAVSC